MSDNSAIEFEIDALSGLEERIQKAVALVSGLRRERDSLTKDLAESHSEVERLTQEMKAMREERSQVRSRIEKLLGHIDQLSL
jgi:FtsZ-binding cell division protein ZapB